MKSEKRNICENSAFVTCGNNEIDFGCSGLPYFLTLVKELPSLMCGVVGNSLFWLMVSEPASRLYRLDITSSRSEVVFTGRKRLRGTFTPMALLKLLMAAPTAVSSWITFKPPSRVYGDVHGFVVFFLCIILKMCGVVTTPLG